LPDLIVRVHQPGDLAPADHLRADEAIAGIDPTLLQIIRHDLDGHAFLLEPGQIRGRLRRMVDVRAADGEARAFLIDDVVDGVGPQQQGQLRARVF
jgi:hypothetical protein